MSYTVACQFQLHVLAKSCCAGGLNSPREAPVSLLDVGDVLMQYEVWSKS
jgi:hypothetical protein